MSQMRRGPTRDRKYKPTAILLVFTLNQLTLILIRVCMGHYHSSRGQKNQHHRSDLRVSVRVSKDGNAVGLTSILDRGQFVF